MSTEIIRGGLAVCIYEPNGEHNLFDFREKTEYGFELCSNIMRPIPYYRIYFGARHKTLSLHKFKKFFIEKQDKKIA